MGHEVYIIASNFSFDEKGKGYFIKGTSEYINKDGIKVIRVEFKKPFYTINRILRRYSHLYQKIEEIEPDLIFTHNISAVDMHQLSRYVRKHPYVKLFGDNHADYINSGRNPLSKYILHPIIWRHYAKEIEPYLEKCFGVTPMRCSFLRDVYHISPEKIDYLPMGIDDEAIPTDRKAIRNKVRKELRVGDKDILIITGGKIDREKNTHILLEALRNLNRHDIHLVICGILTEEMFFLKEYFSNNSIHYLGWCDAPKVINCMVAADVACFPGTHSTLWEQSVGIGLPAIFKRWPEMEHVDINGNCFFVQGENVEELQRAIENITSEQNYNKIKDLATKASENFLYSHISLKAIGYGS